MKMTKRIAAMAACAVITVTSMVGMSASAVETTGITDTVSYSTNDINSAKYISMTHYYQSGQSWSNKHCGGISSNPTIGSEGCAITSFAMVERFYGGSDNPGQVSDKLGSSAYPMNWGTAASVYGMNSPSISYYNNTMLDKGKASNSICTSVRSNKPVIVGLKNSSGNTHFVVARGAAPQNAYVYIYDPASGVNASTLNTYYNSGYYVYETITY